MEIKSSGDIELNFSCHTRQVGPRGCDAQDGTHASRRGMRPSLADSTLCRRVDGVKSERQFEVPRVVAAGSGGRRRA